MFKFIYHLQYLHIPQVATSLNTQYVSNHGYLTEMCVLRAVRSVSPDHSAGCGGTSNSDVQHNQRCLGPAVCCPGE